MDYYLLITFQTVWILDLSSLLLYFDSYVVFSTSKKFNNVFSTLKKFRRKTMTMYDKYTSLGKLMFHTQVYIQPFHTLASDNPRAKNPANTPTTFNRMSETHIST
jgi:hypothetical protein